MQILLPDASPNRESMAPSPAATTKEAEITTLHNQPEHGLEQVRLIITPKKLFLQLKKEPAAIHFIRSLSYARWNSSTFLWEITHSEHNLQQLRHYFADRLTEQHLASAALLSQPTRKPFNARELTVFVRKARLRLLFAFDQQLIRLIKKLPYPCMMPRTDGGL